MPAEFRYETFNKFQTGETTMMSTTDMGSRGLNTVKVGQEFINFILSFEKSSSF